MKHISVADLQHIIESQGTNPEVALINVCSPEEYREAHIAGVQSVPLDQLVAHKAELQEKKTIYVHCRSGNRSRRAIEALEQLGVTAELINVEGGMMAWEAAGLKTVSGS